MSMQVDILYAHTHSLKGGCVLKLSQITISDIEYGNQSILEIERELLVLLMYHEQNLEQMVNQCELSVDEE